MKLLPLLLGFFPLSILAKPTLTTNYRISPDSEIKITFDSSIVKEDQLDKLHKNSLLTIKPNWEGKIKWSSQNIATFIPTEAPKLNTEYSFFISDGVEDLNNSLIKPEKIGTKSTHNFNQIRWKNLDTINNEKRPRTYLLYNDDVEANKLAGFFFYKSEEGKTVAAEITEAKYGDVRSTYYTQSSWTARWKAVFSEPTDSPDSTIEIKDEDIIKNAIIVRPVETLPPGTKWNLKSLKGISNLRKSSKINSDLKYGIGNKSKFIMTSAGAYRSVDEPGFLRIHFNQPLQESLSEAQLAHFITVSPSNENLKYKHEKTFIDIEGDFTQSRKYKITIKSAIPSQNGQFLKQNETEQVEFKDIPASLAIPSFSTAQLSHGQRKYPIKTINMKSIKVRVKALDMTQAVRTHNGYNQYLEAHSATSSANDTKRVPLPFSLVHGNVIFEKDIPLTNKINTSETITLEWDKILPEQRENLIFFLDIEGTPTDKVYHDSRGTHHAQTFIQLTDIGLAWKKSENEELIYCYSCNTGKPLSKVKLTSYDDDANSLHSLITDENGIARIPVNKKSTHLSATLAEDSFVLSTVKEMPTVGLWRFPIQYDWQKFHDWKREALIFTDRELYKPGERVQIKGIVRERKDNEHRIPVKKEASLVIYDAKNKVLAEQELTLSEHGSFDHTLDLPEKNVGYHRIKLSFKIPEGDLPKNNWALRNAIEQNATFYYHFRVQEFRKNAFKVVSSLKQDEEKLRSLTAKLDASYYQGTAVANGNIDWYLTVNKTGFYPEKFQDYYFGDHLEYDYYYWSHYYGYTDGGGQEYDSPVRLNGNAKLSAEGEYSVEHQIPDLDIPSPQKVSLTTEVTDGREQTITAKNSITIHPSTHYIGIKRIDQLIRVGNYHPINLIATNNKGQASKVSLDATVTIHRITYDPTKVRSSTGKVTVHNEKKETLFLTKSVSIDPLIDTKFDFTPDEAGRYNIIVKAKDPSGNSISSAMRCEVYGSSEYPWAVDTGMKIQLVPEKQQYKPGETAKILVKTPIEGTALVTLERNKVIRHFRTELKASDPIIEVPLEYSDAPNVYVSVMLIRGAQDSSNKYKEPTLKLGYCNLNVENIEDKLNVAIDSPEKSYRPDSYVTLTGAVTNSKGMAVSNAELTLYAEDNGVLDVIGYKMPDPLTVFNSKISLYVESGASLDGFLQEMASEDMSLINQSVSSKGYTIGGGDGFGIQDIQNKVRSNFDPCAVWNPTLKTDQAGKFSISFKTPESLTSYKVMAIVTAGNEQFGSAKSEIVVNKPIMLDPLAPRFANEGDIKTTKTLIANNSEFDGTWKVSLKTGSLTSCLGSDDSRELSKIVDLDAGASAYLYFDTKFINTGDARWEWHAEPIKLMDRELTSAMRRDLSDAMESKFKVLFPRPILKGTQFTNLDTDSRSVISEIKPSLLNGRGKVELTLGNNLLFRADGAAEHLLKYPYG